MKKILRSNFFIKKAFQGKLILGYFLFVIFGCLFLIFLFSLFSADTLSIIYRNNDLQLGQTSIMLLKKIIAAHWAAISFGLVILFIAAMLVTHRIAGPMYRFEKVLDNMLAKDLSDKIQLRRKDEGKELANKINFFNTDLSRTLKQITCQSKALEEIISKAKEQLRSLPPDAQDDLRWLYWSMEDKNKKINALSGAYKLKDEA